MFDDTQQAALPSGALATYPLGLCLRLQSRGPSSAQGYRAASGCWPYPLKAKAVVNFEGIPLEQVNKLIEALTGELPQVFEVRLLEKAVPLG